MAQTNGTTPNGTDQTFSRMGIVGAGNMGTSMALGFAETAGVDVFLWDISSANIERARRITAEETKTRKGTIKCFTDIEAWTQSLEQPSQKGAGRQPKFLVFSVPHGDPADSVIAKIRHELKEGDVVLDGGNEHYRATERRQEDLKKQGVHWIGCGVSGGYQSARRGPSMSPGGDREAVQKVLPLLRQFAAKDKRDGHPCVEYIGPRGAGHYVKMVHNGIETGILSGACEAWGLLKKNVGLENNEIGKIFQRWNAEGELKNNFLIQIGSEICQRKKTPEGDGKGEGVGTEGYVLDDVLDKVVQDADDTEGTFFWTVSEAALRHVSAPTIAASQFFRVASADRAQRVKAAKNLQMPAPANAGQDVPDKEAFVEKLRRAVYASYLASYCQGLELIARASKDEGWNVDLGTCIYIWRAGCIIQSDYILDLFMDPLKPSPQEPEMNMKLIKEVSSELRKHYEPLKEVVSLATKWDAYVPSLSASLEYLKYCGGTALPTQFMEAEMDFFGAHSYDQWGVEGEDPGKVQKGRHHYEWRPA